MPVLHRSIPHPADRANAAALHGCGLRGHRSHDGALTEQLGCVRLVLAVHVEDQPVFRSDRREGRKRPGSEGVGVDRERHGGRGCLFTLERSLGIGVQQRYLARESQNDRPGLRCGDRLTPRERHAADR